MPELRSGARQARLRSKRLDDLQPSAQQVDQAENWVLPAQNRPGRRVGTGRGRGNAGAVAKGPSGRQGAAGRGRGVRLIDLDLEQPCEVLPEAAVGGAGGAEDPGLVRPERVADKNLVMEGGGSAEKLVGAEEEASATPVPERVRARVLSFFVVSKLIEIWIQIITGLLPFAMGWCGSHLLSMFSF